MAQMTQFPALFFLQIDPEGILAIGGFYIAVLGIALLFLWRSAKERQFLHKERMALLERVERLPENAHQLLASFAPAKDRDLRAGLIWFIVGVGVSFTLYGLQDSRPYWPGGLIPVFIGLAYLVSFLVLSGRHRRESGETLGGQQASSQPALTERTSPALPVAKLFEEEKLES